jgi:predicted nucleic acid-binding protein
MEFERDPDPGRDVVDAILAATALSYDLILATRNVKDYEDTAVTVLNP